MSYTRDPYGEVVVVLLAGALAATLAAAYAGLTLSSPVLLDVGIMLGISTGMLAGVLAAHRARAHPGVDGGQASKAVEPKPIARPASDDLAIDAGAEDVDRVVLDPAEGVAPPANVASPAIRQAANVLVLIGQRFQRVKLPDFGDIDRIRVGTAVAGAIAVGLVLLLEFSTIPLAPGVAATAASLCLIGAGLTAVAVRYLANIPAERLPEAVGLTKGARVLAWTLVLAALSMGLAWLGQQSALEVIHVVLVTTAVAVCYSLFVTESRVDDPHPIFPVDMGALALLGSRTNIVGSILDAAERQLGIDLRSTWALTVVRSSLEPLVLGLCVMGWLSTSLTVVAVDEQALVERLGVPSGQPLPPGLHLHWPWPVDRALRIPVQRVQMLSVGHEGEEAAGPEDVLWAQQHAANEFTLLLGNGRDLITIDAGVQFRIADARAWRYHMQNPEDALRAVAYRAVMRNTVNRTLTDALSENVVATTVRMRRMVQEDADALGLGVEVLGFTVGGMHPPVPVAPAYQAVVSAGLWKVTAVVNAQAYRNQVVPAADTTVLVNENYERAQGAEALARAAGEAWSFLTLQSEYRAAPQEYFFRRRLETLETNLAGRRFTVVDSRFQRDGGELWVNQP